MRLRNLEDIEKFVQAVNNSHGEVCLTDWLIDAEGNYNFQLNLKSPLCLYMGVSKLLGEHGDWFEIHCADTNDEALFIPFCQDS